MKTKQFLTLVFLSSILCSSIIEAQPSKENFEILPYFKFYSYSWREFGDDGKELLNESGPVFGFGAEPRLYLLKKKNLYLEADFHYYFGKVDYDGFLQDQQGNTTPYKSKTVYNGLEFLVDAGYILYLGKNILIIPIAGLGIEYWNRDIDDGGRYGYDEKYTVFMGQLAVEGVYLLNKDLKFFGNLNFKFPFSISESIDLASRGQGGPSNINLSPKINPRFKIEAGSLFQNFYGSIFFETWTLSKSDPDQGYHQPESTRKHFGARLGYLLSLNL